MAYSSAARNAAKLAGAWLAVVAMSATSILYFDEVRTALGLKLEARDFGLVPPQAPIVAEAETALRARAERTVELRAGHNGHFHTTAYVNGRPIEVMVDTGASMVALTWDDAQRAGLYLSDADFAHRVSTANGSARMAAVMLDTISIEEITVRNVRAAVAEPGKLATSLLGMSFLGQLGGAEMSKGVLVLKE
jgi:aspartyl protease family protein